jgi:hypothetical protein
MAGTTDKGIWGARRKSRGAIPQSNSRLGLQASNCQTVSLCPHAQTLERILMDRERTPSNKPLLDTLQAEL